MTSLNQLDAEDIRKIQSQQAIPDLSAILKELVENAVDAEATEIGNFKHIHTTTHTHICTQTHMNIYIRTCSDVLFDSYGTSSVSVRDNGKGIPLESLVSAG